MRDFKEIEFGAWIVMGCRLALAYSIAGLSICGVASVGLNQFAKD